MFSPLVDAEAKARDHPEWELISQYWMGETPTLVAKTRDTIYADFTGMFDPLTRGKIGELFGTTTNITPDEIFDGKVVVVDIPVDQIPRDRPVRRPYLGAALSAGGRPAEL